MVISAPPATVPPVALQPASQVAVVEPGAARLDQLQGPPGRHPHRHRGTVPHDGRRDRRPQPRPQPAPDPRRQRAQRAAHLGPEVVGPAGRRPGPRARRAQRRDPERHRGPVPRDPARPAQGQPPLGPLPDPPGPAGRRAAAGSRAAAPHHTAATTAYRVRAGDTLGAIALRHHTSVAKIARASKISSRALIHPGQVLRVPGRAKASTKSSVPDTFNGVKYPQAVARAAAHNRAILAGRSVPSRSETRAMIVRIARQQGVDPRLALAIAYQESGWNQRAVSPANAVGVMQVIPAVRPVGLEPRRTPPGPAEDQGQHHRGRGDAACPGPLDEQHEEDRRRLLPGTRSAAEARHVRRHQAVRRNVLALRRTM